MCYRQALNDLQSNKIRLDYMGNQLRTLNEKLTEERAHLDTLSPRLPGNYPSAIELLDKLQRQRHRHTHTGQSTQPHPGTQPQPEERASSLARQPMNAREQSGLLVPASTGRRYSSLSPAPRSNLTSGSSSPADSGPETQTKKVLI